MQDKINFTTRDYMYEAAEAILQGKSVTIKEEDDTEDEMEEAVDTKAIAAQVKTLKVGDNTNFGVVKEIGANSVTFKGKDTPLTKIKFNQYRMGSRELALAKLMKL